MKKLIIILLLVFARIAAHSQTNDDFHAFAKKEKGLMLKAYGNKDVPGYKKHLDEFVAKYNKLNEKEKSNYSYYLHEEYYLLACAYAAKGDKKSAVDCLEKSKDDDYNELLADHDLDVLRKDPRFIKFLDAAKNKVSKYQTALQAAPKYNTEGTDTLPAFTYQSPDDLNLVALKTAYNLDSVAGKGNDVSQIINLMEWVHYLMPHDGSKGNPKPKNAMSFITECRKNNKTLNCRGLAITLNEVYLAEGFKSRFVTCLPLDKKDQDCHVITIVWSASLKKWLWMDPTFMAYIMNEEGTPLSIEEVRDRLINNKPLILNPDANRNHAASQTKQEYLGYYMSKNLYKLECPAGSQYDYETGGEGKSRTYIQLLPGNTKPAPAISIDMHDMPSYSLYYTNNPKTFWAPPPADSKPAGSAERTTADYEQAIRKFKDFYNNDQADSIRNMFSDQFGEHKKSMWPSAQLISIKKEYGEMKSFKWVGVDDDGTMLFKTEFTNSTHAMGIDLDEKNKLLNFRFETSSPYIDKLIAKER